MSFHKINTELIMSNFSKYNHIVVPKRLKRTTYKQFEDLLNYVTANEILLKPKHYAQELVIIHALWEEFAKFENSKGHGPSKTANQWKKIFSEWKVNTRRKYRQIQKFNNRSSGSEGSTRQLSVLEERLLKLINAKPQVCQEDVDQSISFNSNTSEGSFSEINAEGATNNKIIINDTSIKETDNEQTAPEYIVLLKQEEYPDSPELSKTNNEYLNTTREEAQKIPKLDTSNVFPTNDENGSNFQETSNFPEFDESQPLLGQALDRFVHIFNTYSNTYQENTKIERAKLKLEYYKVFGNFVGFDEFYNT